MAEKRFNARIIHKHETEANWLLATNFIPLQGEIIVYDKDSTHNYERIKIGDGVTVVSSLPFVDDTKVDKVAGKGLSTNDYTTAEKNKLAGIATGANKTVVDTALSSSSTNPVQNKVVNTAISNLSALVGDTSVSQQISNAIAQIDYPVDSVNGKTGAVQLTASDVGALPDTTELPVKNVFTARTTSTSYAITATCDGFTYTPGNILVLACGNEISTIGNRSLNVNGLGARDIYVSSTNSTFSSVYGYRGVINSADTLLLMYDQYDHFVVVSHFGKEIMYEDLESEITEKLGPSSSSAEVGQFVRLSEDGCWAAETVEIPSIEGLATETYVDTKFETMVGDTSVSEQIEAAQIVYVGPTQPTDPNIKVWINTAEEGTGVVPVLPRVATITLAASSWTGNSAPYSQTVSINTVTSATKIDLQPTVAQIVSMQNDDIALMAENSDGVVTIYSFGGKPSSDMTMQVLLTEVSYV